MSFPLEKYRFYKKGNKIFAVSTYAGRTVRASAKCADEDTYDEEIGKKLAAARCNVKVAEKRQSRAADKYCEAIKNLVAAEKLCSRMQAYFEDSTAALSDAVEELADLEKTC